MNPQHDQSQDKVPQFSSREEEAEFWETHDVTDHLQEMDPVQLEVAENLSEGLTIRLTPEMMQELRAQAREKGMGASTLARMWILEHLTTRPQVSNQPSSS